MLIPWIDLLIIAAAILGAFRGRKKGMGVETWRILRRLFPAIFGFGLYRAMAAILVKLPGIGQGPAEFFGFLLIFISVILLVHKGRTRFRSRFIAWGNQRPAKWAAFAGAFRSLLTSALVLFLLAKFPLEAIRQTVHNGSWLARLLG